ncbi:MAG: ATP-binding protein [Kofleriaceae bacterium]
MDLEPAADERVLDAPLASAPAYRDAHEHLYDHLERVAWCLERLELLQRAADEPLTGARRAELERLEDDLLAKDRSIAIREAGALAAGRELPLSILVQRFALDAPALHFLVAAALPSLDVDLGHRLAALVDGAGELTTGQLIELLAFDDHDQGVVAAQAETRGALCQHRLIRVFPARGYVGETPLWHRRVSVPERVVAFLRGDCVFRDDAFRHIAHVEAPLRVEPSPTMTALRAMLITGERPIVIAGPAQIGKLTTVAAAAAAVGRQVVAASLEGLLATADPVATLGELLRERRLIGAMLVVRLGEPPALPAALERELLAAADAGELVLTVRDASFARKLRAPRIVHVGLACSAEQVRLWRAQLQRHVGWSGLDLDSLARRYPLGPGDLCEAAHAACATATLERRNLALEDLVTAARARVQHLLGDVAELVTTSLTWSDLVLRDEVTQRILEVVAAVRFREQVLGRWGFAAKMPYGRSVTALFSGPPGTGKTMVATLIAKELGLELFRIDLSKVVSKWVGETEKNLGKVFEHARVSGAALLFDEADALFAKRTEVKSSNDRYANLEVNYLLQRLESFDGVALLTTNHLTSIDPAFLRRVRFRVEFPEPDELEREALWRSMVPPSAPLADDVDFCELAQRFKVAGGYIKNAVVRAAFLAAGDRAPAISHALLSRAAQLEWTELGNLPK